MIYCVFDLLVAGDSLMALPLELRKSLLTSLFTPAPTHSVLVVEAVPENGLGLFQLAEQMKLEGLTAKLADSHYLPGIRSDAWRKLKRKPVDVSAVRSRSAFGHKQSKGLMPGVGDT